MVDEIKRRDKLFIIFFALSALCLAVANPADLDIRSVAWDFSLGIIAICGLFWGFSEFVSQISSWFTIDTSVNKIVSRSDMIDMVGEVTGIDKKKLNNMTDVELSGLMNSVSGSNGSGGMVSLPSLLMKVFRIIIRLIRFIYNLIKGIRSSKETASKTKSKLTSKINDVWQEEWNRK
jgi:hypothetical protein